jgi:small nuclear ribonucleoprotein (snRNP)-like protein
MIQEVETTKLENLTPSTFLDYLRQSQDVDVKITSTNGMTYNGLLRSLDEHMNITLFCHDYQDVEFSASVKLVTESLVYIKGSEIESISTVIRVYQKEK